MTGAPPVELPTMDLLLRTKVLIAEAWLNMVPNYKKIRG